MATEIPPRGREVRTVRESGEARRPLIVLIVDFSPMMRAMLKRVIQLSRVPIAEIFEAANGKEALAVLDSKPVDALFTTLSMPEMSGIELLHHVYERPEWDGMLRVAVGANVSTESRLELNQLKVERIVETPFRPEIVREILLERVGHTCR